MPPKNRSYKKPKPTRDATIFIVVCEGEVREPEYFRFFCNKLIKRIRVIPIPCVKGKSAPLHLQNNARNAEKGLKSSGKVSLWYVLDIDNWKIKHIKQIRRECKSNHSVVLSNPCFEVWLYYHFAKTLPSIKNINKPSSWKNHLPKIIKGGFDSNRHPIKIIDAIPNSKTVYSETGNIPNVGCTQVFRLAEIILPLIKEVIED